MKPKSKINIDELLKAVESKKTQELMSPAKPLKRQLHIEILNWKDNKIKTKLAIKPKDIISKMIVEFNVANREILKIKKIKGQLIDIKGFLRMKPYAEKYGYSGATLNTILNNMFPECKVNGEKIDYWKLTERIYIFTHATNMERKDLAVVGILFKDKVNKATGDIINYSGDITRFAMVNDKDKEIKETLSKIQTYFIKKLPMIRLVINKGTKTWIELIGSRKLKDYGWYRSHGDNDGRQTGSLDGYFPSKIITKYGCTIPLGEYVVLSDEAKRFYRETTPHRIRPNLSAIFDGLHGTSPVGSMMDLRSQVTEDLQNDINAEVEYLTSEGYDSEEIDERVDQMVDDEVERRLELRREAREAEALRIRGNCRSIPIRDVNEESFIIPNGITVMIAKGNDSGRRGLTNEPEMCTIVGVETPLHHVYYKAEFSNGSRWNVRPEEITEIIGRLTRYNGEELPLETEVLIRNGNANGRTNLNDGIQMCMITDAKHLYDATTRRYAELGQFDYEAKFPNYGDTWYIKTEEITDVVSG